MSRAPGALPRGEDEKEDQDTSSARSSFAAVKGRAHARMWPMRKLFVLAACLVLSLTTLGYARDKKPHAPATKQQESYMMGRIFGAIEDEGGGFKDEALFRLERIDQDIDKLVYSAETRWNAHYLYAKVLMETKNRKKAAKIIALAQQDAQSLDADKQKQTEQLAQEIQKP
jgi:hypothetical protein